MKKLFELFLIFSFLLVQIGNLSNSDNLGEWRKIESESLALKVQKNFYDLQNPNDCGKQKKVLCDLNKSCGFGCQMHHVMYCFITSYFLNRTLLLDSTGWRYNPNGFEAYFMPLSEKCTKIDQYGVEWNGRTRKFLFFFLYLYKKVINSNQLMSYIYLL